MFSGDRLPGRAEQCVQIMVTANTAPLCFHTHLFFLACANTRNVTFTTSAAHLPPQKWKNTVPKTKCTQASVWRLLGWMFYYVFLQPSQCLFCPVGHRFGDATIMLLLINSSQTKALSRCTVKKNISLSTLLWMAQHRQEKKSINNTNMPTNNYAKSTQSWPQQQPLKMK